MYSFVFKSKLKRLNDSLYIDESKRTHVEGEYYSAPLRLSLGKQRKALTSADYAQIGGAEEKFIRDQDSGLVPEFMCSIPVGWVPEYDIFQYDKAKHRQTLVARGWRSILLNLVAKKAISLDKARAVFECGDLGMKSYDKLDGGQKLAMASKTRKAS